MARSASNKFTDKQQRFIDEYLVDLNGTQAAIRAGYSRKTANEIAAELLAKPSIRAAVDAGLAKRRERTEISQDYVLRTIHETVERCRQVAPVLDRKGFPVVVETPKGSVAPAYVFDAKEVLKGCELLGRHLGMFPTKVEHSGEIRRSDARELSDEELLLIAAGFMADGSNVPETTN
jgi:phage terminase small subunit